MTPCVKGWHRNSFEPAIGSLCSPLADSEIFNKFGSASFSDRGHALRNHDFVSDGFLALIATCLVQLCSSLLGIALSSLPLALPGYAND